MKMTNLEVFKQRVIQDGEALVLSTFPERVLELQDLLDSPRMNFQQNGMEMFPLPVLPSGISKVSNEAHHKSQWHLHESTPEYSTNPVVKELCEIVKGLFNRMLEEVRQVRLWMQLNVPHVEDGNTFGVEVLASVLENVRNVENDSKSHNEIYLRYHKQRAKGIARMGLYPQVEDFRVYVRELDLHMALRLRAFVASIRNRYMVLQDKIAKNMDKIRCPRGETDSLSQF